jgi:hypothetical protein
VVNWFDLGGGGVIAVKFGGESECANANGRTAIDGSHNGSKI